MTGRAHTPRPTDIVALVAFDGREYPNLAVTREQIGRAPTTPHLLGAALEQWLRRGRRTWVDVRGRQIHGVATARVRSGAPGLRVWEIDALIETGEPSEESARALLEQAAAAAASARVATVLLRTYADHPVLEQAAHAGFEVAWVERAWSGTLADGTSDVHAAAPTYTVRALESIDRLEEFRLHQRSAPLTAREALGMTFEHWLAAQDERVLGRHPIALGAFAGAELRAVARRGDRRPTLLDLCADDAGAACALLSALTAATPGDGAHKPPTIVALVPRYAGAVEQALAWAGCTPGAEYAVLSRRIAQPVRDEARVRVRLATVR